MQVLTLPELNLYNNFVLQGMFLDLVLLTIVL